MTHAEFFLILGITLASGIVGYMLRSRHEQEIFDRGYRAGLHRYHSSRSGSPTPSPRQ